MSTKSSDVISKQMKSPGSHRSESTLDKRQQLPEAMEGGVKLKMPVGLLGHVTRTQNALDEMRRTGGVEGVIKETFLKYRNEMGRLKEACNMVQPVDDIQKAAKKAWMERNVVGKEQYLEALQRVFEAPELQLNDKAVNEKEDQDSMRSARSNAPSVVSVSSSVARREAAAKTKVLELELEHRHRQRQLEEEERRLRHQREDEELALKLQQARVTEEILESERGSRRAESVNHMPLRENISSQPQMPCLPPVSTWAPRPPVPPSAPVVTSWTTPAVVGPQEATQGLIQQVLLPQSTLPTFKGDYLDFMWFLKTFEMRVESVTSDPTRRLHLLLQHLEGDPKTLIMGCQLADDPHVGYARAKEKLVDKYGNKIRQALAFKAKLLSWPNIKKDAVNELERFSVQLQLCQDVKLTGGLLELDAAGTLLQLMRKLPQKMQEAWQMRAYKVESHQYREANFDDFTKFVSDTAAARNHPVYGSQWEAKPEVKKNVKALATVHEANTDEEAQTTTMATKSSVGAPLDATRGPCLLCEGSHATDKCRKAPTLTIKERRRRLGGLCFACLKDGHAARDCTKRAECFKCKGSHPTILHVDKPTTNDIPKSKVQESGTPSVTEPTDKGAQGTQSDDPTAKACATIDTNRVAVAVVPIKVWCGKQRDQKVVKAVLDPGSTATFITNKLVQQLGITTTPSSLQLTTMTADKQRMNTQVVAGVKAASLDQNEVLTLPPMYTVETMPYTDRDVVGEEDVLPYNHLKDIPFAWEPGAGVELLIGMNAPAALKPQEVISGGEHEPYAVKTALGWCLNGPLSPRECNQVSQVTANLIRAKEVGGWLEKLHNADFKGAYDFDQKGLSQDDKTWLQKVERSVIKLNTNQFQIALPFKQTPPPLQNNVEQASQRLHSLKKKLMRSATFKDDYTAFMNKMEQNGYVEIVPNPESPAGQVFYVPHHGVYHPRKPGKIRVVFNCSSKFKGLSLNDCLIPGPDLTNSLLGVLIRFRQEAVAFMADIESMFYRVQIPAADRDMLRYLWWPGGDVDTPQGPQTYRMKVHLFGATSSPSCANFALRRAADEAQGQGEDKDVCEAIRTNFYVDDCLKSMPDDESAIRMATGLMRACASGGFRLTKFVSTSTVLLKSLPEKDLAKGLSQVNLDDDKHDPLGALQERALGVLWDVSEDVFRLSVAVHTNVETKKDLTKRVILSTLSAVYDPIGIAAPVIIVARILFRDLTREQAVMWDDNLDPKVINEWVRWLEDLQYLSGIKLRRCLRPAQSDRDSNVSEWQLHTFCDASENAYSAVIYLRRWTEGQQRAHVVFVMGKARVSPPKVVTIPRLELTAAKLATDLARTVERELQYPISKRTFWTDSQTVIKYLNNKERRFHTFVANRVGSILAASSANEWRHVPTHLNPADEGSRGLEASSLRDGLWLKGPDFLGSHEENWPQTMSVKSEADDKDPEMRTLATNTVSKAEKGCFVETLAGRYSSFFRLKVAVQVWRRFAAHLRHEPVPALRHGLEDAERSIVKSLQAQCWQEELDALQAGGTLRKDSTLRKLNPMVAQDGTLTIGSRIRDHLPIIPGTSKVATLLVQEAHERQAHFGRQATTTQVLRKFWITGLNKLVRKVVRECPSCQRRHAKPNIPLMGELPFYRIEAGRAFETTGVDYFGPFLIKRNRTTCKMYGVIFTCAAVRAVHLEVAEDLSASSFINALRRFVARRGQVKRLVSDNGTNFVGANTALTQEIQKEMKQLQSRKPGIVTNWLAQRSIEWVFNPPGASHHGGFWERLIRSVRKALATLLPEQRPLTYDGVATVLCEVEAILNNRPLTTVSEDPHDLDALTPNHLLLGMAGPVAPPGDYKRIAIPLKRQWRQVQHVATCFWRRWMNEYRALLHQRRKWLEDSGRSLAVNDVVLVIDNLKPREYWPLAIVVALHAGKDGKVRVVTVKTTKGEMRRSVNKLCVLETASLSHSKHV